MTDAEKEDGGNRFNGDGKQNRGTAYKTAERPVNKMCMSGDTSYCILPSVKIRILIRNAIRIFV